LSNFSGYIAIDELYEGRFCILSLVDNRSYRRLIYEVLEHDPTHEDIERFLRRLKGIMDCMGLTLSGVTTDGSPLYPEPLRAVFGDVPHQVCEFHVLKEILGSVRKAVAKVRKSLKKKMPKLGRGRPRTKKQKQAAREQKRLKKKIQDLFDHKGLFGKKHLTPAERRTLHRITRGLPELRVLRQIVEEVYRLFDRRCRTHTALEKLRRLRQQVRRFKKVGKTLQKLFSPNVEKALTFLDDRLLPSTSNAVERGNRRHRKMQASVYRVRTPHTLKGRMALDLIRDQLCSTYVSTIQALHRTRARNGTGHGRVSSKGPRHGADVVSHRASLQRTA
jgi:tRNA C32,U32 (ribose-2'-O)-methylase TrmJ